jgi:hypothetical protein
VSADLSEHVSTPPADGAGDTTAWARRHRRRGVLLAVIGLWNVYVWVTRFWNLAQDPTPRTTSFVAVHAVLYGVSFAFALVLCTVGWRMWREGRGAR